MSTISRAIVDGEGDRSNAAIVPQDAATLIIIDRSAPKGKVLLGRRHTHHKFMPGKFVFPGGRLDATDRLMPAAKPLHREVERRLLAQLPRPSDDFARALGLAAIRETFEETGLVIGAKGQAEDEVPAGSWAKFVQTGYQPDLSVLHLIARATTPPGFPRRFDARFFCADASAIAHRVADVIRADTELTELTWLPIADAQNLDLPVITGLVLEELEVRLAAGFGSELSVPFYCQRNDEFTRELIH